MYSLRLTRTALTLVIPFIVVSLILPAYLKAKGTNQPSIEEADQYLIEDILPTADIEKKSPVSVWLNLGLGLGSAIYFDTSMSIAAAANLTFQIRDQILSIRSAGCTAIMDATISDKSIMYGRVFKSASHYISLGAGISKIRYEDDGKIVSKTGIPLELQFFFKKTSCIGLYCFANINSIRSFYAVCLCFRIGRFR